MNAPKWVVAIGASAGGVEALRSFFRELEVGLDAAFVVVLHIPAHSPSQLHDVIQTHTPLKVCRAENNQPLQAGHVYVAPSDLHLMVQGDLIRLTRGRKESRARPSIDVLLRSVAVSQGSSAVGIILSGMLDDGTAGLWAIKDHGGFALVQDPGEAMYPSMPESAANHVAVDFIGKIAALAQEVTRIVSTTAAPAPAGAGSSRHGTENKIANEGNALQLGVMTMGEVSQYTCPDCHGVLVQIEEGSIVRFRCHTGHAFSLLTLLAEVSEAIDKGLWATLRSLEERVMLLRQLDQLAKASGKTATGNYAERATETEERIKPLRHLVLDEKLFGRQR